jgi:putative acetyltransferase
MTRDLEIRRIRVLDDPAIVALVARSDEYLGSLYPTESNHAVPLSALSSDDAAFFAAYLGDELAACGAVKMYADDPPYGEIKRVFVAEEHRGRHLATAVMAFLEAFLLEQSIRLVRLEAGPKQPAALALYEKLGYEYRGPFGAYLEDPLSVFMEKKLVPA